MTWKNISWKSCNFIYNYTLQRSPLWFRILLFFKSNKTKKILYYKIKFLEKELGLEILNPHKATVLSRKQYWETKITESQSLQWFIATISNTQKLGIHLHILLLPVDTFVLLIRTPTLYAQRGWLNQRQRGCWFQITHFGIKSKCDFFPPLSSSVKDVYSC